VEHPVRLIHWTTRDRPLLEIEPRQPTRWDRNNGYMKPAGLWLSDEDDYSWSQWCHDADFALDDLQLGYEITMAEANVRLIQDVAALDAFSNEFGYEPEWHRGIGYTRSQYIKYIDWPVVASRYQGVLITPYLWQRRLDYMWYYGWDCASGVIWDPAAIASFKLAETLKT
jgi:hypothetical protein